MIVRNIRFHRSVQNAGSIHVAPLSAARTTVHTGQEQSSTTSSSSTSASQTEPTPGQLAEAAAASAFEPFEPGTPLSSRTDTDTVFAPKISSTDLHSSASSPTLQYQNLPPLDQSTIGSDSTTSTGKTSTKSTEIPIQRESDIRDEILRASLKYVQEKGWTMEAIRAGVRDCNQPTTVEGLFGNGYDLVEYFIRDANTKMTTYMNEKAKKYESTNMSFFSTIFFFIIRGDLQGTRLLIDGLKYRLSLTIPYANTWDQVMSIIVIYSLHFSLSLGIGTRCCTSECYARLEESLRSLQ